MSAIRSIWWDHKFRIGAAAIIVFFTTNRWEWFVLTRCTPCGPELHFRLGFLQIQLDAYWPESEWH